MADGTGAEDERKKEVTHRCAIAPDPARDLLLRLVLPWPPADLSPNSRVHWSKLARAKKAYRAACGWAAIEQGAARIEAERLHLTLVFVPPNRRAHDLDNCLARIKSGLDGLTDVLEVDDKRWSLTISKADEVGGMVRVEVRRA